MNRTTFETYFWAHIKETYDDVAFFMSFIHFWRPIWTKSSHVDIINAHYSLSNVLLNSWGFLRYKGHDSFCKTPTFTQYYICSSSLDTKSLPQTFQRLQAILQLHQYPWRFETIPNWEPCTFLHRVEH